MNINETVKEVYTSAVDKGLWKNLNREGFYRWLEHELDEAHEAVVIDGEIHTKDGTKIPVGEKIELGDMVLLIMSYFGKMGWDLQETLRIKMDYNKTRNYGHEDIL